MQVYDQAMCIKTSFPRFQEYFTLTVHLKSDVSATKSTIGKMYVGKYFTSLGEFDEVSATLMPLFCVAVLSVVCM